MSGQVTRSPPGHADPRQAAPSATVSIKLVGSEFFDQVCAGDVTPLGGAEDKVAEQSGNRYRVYSDRIDHRLLGAERQKVANGSLLHHDTGLHMIVLCSFFVI